MLDLTTKTSAELVELLRTIPVNEWNAAVMEARQRNDYWRANLYGASLDRANLDSANLYRADLRGANLDSANLYRANLRGANLYRAYLDRANLNSANLYRANLNGASLDRANLHKALIDGEPITIQQWCDIFDMPTSGKGLRVGFKRLPKDRITGREYNNGKHMIEWKGNKWVEAPDWNDSGECGGGLHLSPTATMTRSYSGDSLCIAVAFDPKDAVMIGDKLKVRRCKVL